MRKSYKRVLGACVIAGVLCLGGVLFLRSRAPDFWGYGKLGINDGTGHSPIFFVEIRGVGRQPTVAYIVRCSDESTAPKNMLEVSYSAIARFDERTRVMDRWRSKCILVVGRKVGEQIVIPLDTATARHWFDRPDVAIGDYASCRKFWDDIVVPRIAEFDRNQRAAL